MTKPKSLRMKLHEMNRPPEYLQAYPSEEMDAYLYELESEIPELRNKYAGMIAERDVLRGEKRKLQAENARLKEALERVVAWGNERNFDTTCESGKMLIKARAALGKED